MKVHFVNTLREHHVTLSSCPLWSVALLGMVAWLGPLVTYVVGYVSSSGTAKDVWLSNVVLHVVTGLLVDVDALWFGGTRWPLQAVIIGTASYITFTLPGLFGYYLSIDDRAGVALTLASLALVCLANATMMGILFELFHRATVKKPPPTPARIPRGLSV